MSKIAFSILLIQSLSLGIFGFAVNDLSIATNSSNLKIINDHFTKSNNGLSQYGEKPSSQSFGGDKTCIFCSSIYEDEEDCWQLPNQNKYQQDCSLYQPNTGKEDCFTFITPDQILRGCIARLDENGYHECLQLSNCIVCYGNDCNNKRFQTCDAPHHSYSLALIIFTALSAALR